jgi:hypothetical protein
MADEIDYQLGASQIASAFSSKMKGGAVVFDVEACIIKLHVGGFEIDFLINNKKGGRILATVLNVKLAE